MQSLARACFGNPGAKKNKHEPTKRCRLLHISAAAIQAGSAAPKVQEAISPVGDKNERYEK